MKGNRFTTALLAALALSGGCTLLLSRTLSRHTAPVAPKVMYAAPAHALQAGEILKADDVELVAWAGNEPIASAFSRIKDVEGRALLYPLDKGQPFLDRDLSANGAANGLAAKIPPGMRALALRSDEVAGVAGFLNPGSRVDALVTYRQADSSDSITATVLQNVEVLAVGQRAQPDPDLKPTSATVVTLLLTPDESERAVLASTQGMIHFVLRNSSDAVHAESTPMFLSMLSGGTAPVAAHSVAPHPSTQQVKPIRDGIETILGGTEPLSKDGGSTQ